MSSSSPSRPLPGDLAMWFFILAELLVFGIFFVIYAEVRRHHIDLFDATQLNLNRFWGLCNTLFLLSGSYCVVRAVSAISQDRQRICARWMGAALLCGLAFVLLKGTEFAEKIGQGVSLSTNTFYTFYLFLAFFHFMHVILGMVILAAVTLRVRQGAYSAAQYSGVETAASYWHMVDLVWIVLFPLVYVLR